MLATIGTASAHAELLASDPADGAVLGPPPAAVTLTFSEPVDPLVVRLTDPDGRTRILRPGAPSPEGSSTRLVLPLPRALGQGTHSLSWRVTSADGHPVGGGLVFSIGRASAPGPASGQAVESVTRASLWAGLWAARLLAMIGLVIGVGGAGWAALLDRTDGGSRWLVAALLTGLAATPVWIGFQGLDALGETIGALKSPAVWTSGLTATAYGRAALLTAAALIAALVSLRIAAPRARAVLAASAFAIAGLGAAVAGHAATAPPRIATVPAIVLHMLAAMAWIGGLLPLRQALTGRDGARALRLFSRLIPLVFAVLVASGLLLAIVQVRTPANLWTTAYGRVLLAKLAIVALLVALAAGNRFRLTRPAAAGQPRALRRLRQSIATEVFLGTVVLAILGLWRFTPPPRALATIDPPAQERIVEKDGLTATLSIMPPRTGPVRVAVTDILLDGAALRPLAVTVELARPEDGIGPFTRAATRDEDGAYRADGFMLPRRGAWAVRVAVLVDDFRSVTLTDRFDLAGPAP